MYCTNCGTELNENANFCANCGTNIRGVSSPGVSVVCQPRSTDTIKRLLHGAKEKISAIISRSDDIHSTLNRAPYVGGALIIVCLLLFALGTCINSMQVVEALIKRSIDVVVSLLPVPIKGSDIELSAWFEIFWPLVLIGLIATVVELGGLFLIALYHKKTPGEAVRMLNVIGYADIITIIGLLVNLLIGLFAPVATPAIFSACLLIHLISVYIGTKILISKDNGLFWEFAIMIFAVAIITSIAFVIAWDEMIISLITTLLEFADLAASDVFSMIEGILGLWG